MPRRIRDLKAELRNAGARQTGQERSHTKWKRPLVPGTLLVLSGHEGDEAKPYQIRDLRDALRRIEDARQGDKK